MRWVRWVGRHVRQIWGQVCASGLPKERPCLEKCVGACTSNYACDSKALTLQISQSNFDPIPLRSAIRSACTVSVERCGRYIDFCSRRNNSLV